MATEVRFKDVDRQGHENQPVMRGKNDEGHNNHGSDPVNARVELPGR
jgi:hypothetical protein